MSDPAASASAAAAQPAAAAGASAAAAPPVPPVQSAAPAAPPTAGQTAAPSASAADPGDLPPEGLTVEAQLEHWKTRANGLRAKLAERGSIPENPDGYTLTFEGDLQPYSESLKTDPVFRTMREQFHKAGLTDKQTQAVVAGTLDALLKAGQLEPPFDPQKEIDALLPNERDPTRRRAEASRMVTDNLAWLDGLKGQLSDRGVEALKSLQDRAGGIEAVQALAAMTRAPGPIGGGAQPPAVTRESLAARQADPRNRYGDAKYDPAFAAETTRLYQQAFPDEG